MSEEIEIETTGHSNNRFYCFVYWLRRTTAGPSSDAANTLTGATPRTVTSTPPTLSKAGPVALTTTKNLPRSQRGFH